MSKKVSITQAATNRIEKSKKLVSEKTGKDLQDITPSDIILYFVRV